MDYRLDMGAWNQVFAVPSALVDQHIKLAGKEQLQVILWVLRHGGERFSPETLSEALGVSPDTVQDALEYWCDRGLLAAEGEALRPAPLPEKTESVPVPQPRQLEPAPRELPPKKRMLRPDGEHLAARMAESEAMRFLMQEAEAVLGKTLSPAMTSLLVTVTDDYGLPVEVVVMLLHYVAEVSKTGTSYIDAVAREWAEAGIFSVAAAEERLRALSKERQAWARVSAAAGLSKRAPSKTEAQRAVRWVEEWHFSDEMLSAAYDACAEHTGKFSAAYMDKVLFSWYEKGIHTPEELAESRRAVQGKAQEESRSGKSYDIDELAAMSTLDLPEEL